jgi:hypothetical protein
MNDEIDAIIQNTQRYHFEDGLTELFMGALGLLGSAVLLFSIGDYLQTGIWFTIGLIVIARLLEWSRRRFTYPRSGYVTYREHKSQLWKTLLGTGIALISIGVALAIAISLDDWHNVQWIPLIIGAFIGAILIWQGIRLHLRRLIFLGIYSVLVGMIWSPLVMAPRSTEFYYGILYFGFYLFFFGIGAVISGGIQFWRFMRQNPRVTEAIHE